MILRLEPGLHKNSLISDRKSSYKPVPVTYCESLQAICHSYGKLSHGRAIGAGLDGSSLPLITRPANFPPPVARTAGQYGRRRALFREPEDAEASSGESSEDDGSKFEATVPLPPLAS